MPTAAIQFSIHSRRSYAAAAILLRLLLFLLRFLWRCVAARSPTNVSCTALGMRVVCQAVPMDFYGYGWHVYGQDKHLY